MKTFSEFRESNAVCGSCDDDTLNESSKDYSFFKKGNYEAIGRSDELMHIEYKGKSISTGDYDEGAWGWFMNIKGESGQPFFREPKDIVDFFIKKKITEPQERVKRK